ncbi:MAG: oligopeptide transporter, OPT family [Candidatus Eiseniibacteriota bacterium]|nr:MAG: oligopeptide transporter, OPT family [Candidatus Eisenbacteria bacterium]
MRNEHSGPFVPAEKSISEFTLKAVVLGLLLGLVMTAANVYLGLYAGMTVSASIPAAVISMGVLRGLLRRGTILENNIVQTIASAGESLAAGIIFTVPALVIAGVWLDFKYWPVTLIAMFGGLLGVVFMIPLRRSLIVEEKELVYPEGLACAEVLETGERGGSGVLYVFSAMLLSVVFKFFVSAYSVIKGTVQWAWEAGRTAFYAGSDMSVALIGVGFVVGPNVAALVFIGGAIGWLVGIPILGAVQGIPAGDTLIGSLEEMWSSQIRYMGVGAMVVGGIASIIKVRRGIADGMRSTILGYTGSSRVGQVKRTEQDMGTKMIAVIAAAAIVPTFFLYGYLTSNVPTAIVAGVAMVVTGFFFVAVSSYIVGLVGSSNNPVSGMTICTVLFSSALLLLMGMTGASGIIAALGVAGVVCCAACTAGDVSQDLKTGYLVGATPRRQQLSQVIGVVIPAFIIAPVLTVLHSAHGIGVPVKEGVPFLRAPQATLFASIVKAMFSDMALPWTMVGIGAAIGLLLLVLDIFLKERNCSFRAHVMPVAVGIYLPVSLSTPILFGGIINHVASLIVRTRGENQARGAIHNGVLFSSGLIAGESITGIIVAALIYAKFELPQVLHESDWASLLLFGLAACILFWVSARRVRVGGRPGSL